jgi:N-acylglucosamine-6-phosphate 2-epimerase
MEPFGMTWAQEKENKSVGRARTSTLETLRGGLVASCQPVDGGPMDRPDIVAAMAQAAVAGGAVGLRVEGVDNLRAVRPVVDVPIIGIVKTDSPDTPVRITVAVDDAAALIAVGADIVAYDATARPRLHSRDQVLRAILDGGALAMADCATLEDAQYALSGGAHILGTTLSGYTGETETPDNNPDLALVGAFRSLGPFVMAEGRYNTPTQAAKAISAGADSVTVGSALTRLEHVTGWFAGAIQETTA